VPSVYPPYGESGQEEHLETLYRKLQAKEIGGWCSLNTVILNRFLGAYGIQSEFLNYGMNDKFLTHMVLIVHYEGNRFILDPFFNRHYKDKHGNLLTYTGLIMKIIYREFDDIKSVYGASRKPTKYIPAPLERHESAQSDRWINYLPEVFEQKVMAKFKKAGLKKELEIFGSDNPLLLMLFPLR